MANRYLHLFNTTAQYETARENNYKEPWTSLTVENDEINYNKPKFVLNLRNHQEPSTDGSDVELNDAIVNLFLDFVNEQSIENGYIIKVLEPQGTFYYELKHIETTCYTFECDHDEDYTARIEMYFSDFSDGKETGGLWSFNLNGLA